MKKIFTTSAMLFCLLALQPVGPGLDITVLHRNVGAHGLQPGDVQIDRPRADGTAARQRHSGLAQPRHQRSQD